MLFRDPSSGLSFPMAAAGGSAALTVRPAAAAAATSTASSLPARLVAGVPAEFTVTPRDAWGNAGAHGAALEAALVPVGGGAAVPGRVAEGNEGTLRVTLAPTAAGAFRLVARLAGQPLLEAEVAVEGAATHAGRTTLGAFWPECGAVAGSASGFVIRVSQPAEQHTPAASRVWP